MKSNCNRNRFHLSNYILSDSFLRVLAQAAQTHVAREGCNVIYVTYVTRAGVALHATVENIRDFVWDDDDDETFI